jgi:hypothetical protein
MEMLDSKSLLAKLMATENLIVEQKAVDTASFDVKNRVLTLPILDKNISGYLYDLFVAHEVGHALYTPEEGMKKAIDLNLNMSLMNVLEDSRIERKIKYKYPGVRASFVRGYKELIEKDFFGTKGVNLSSLRFIDRANLFCKGGPTQGIDFTEEERDLIQEIESTNTYDDVIELAKKLSQYAEQEQEERKKKIVLMPDEDGDEEMESFDNSFYDDSDEESEDEEFFVPKNGPTEDDAKPKEEGNDQVKNDGSAGAGDTDIEDEEADKGDQTKDMAEGSEGGNDTGSKTDEAFQENQKRLFATSGETYYYANLPEVDLDKIIVTYKDLWKEHKEYYKTWEYDEGLDIQALAKVRQDSTKIVSYLAKEFELRKNADQMKRASISKTGELNMAKIFSYKFNEDLFKKATIVPNGKSHGLVMFVDWSGSMTDHLEGTIKQLINLALFCRKVLIPFEVYAFSDEHRKADSWQSDVMKEGNLQMHKLSLLNFLSSKMSAAEFNYACAALLRACNRYRPEFLQLGGTPLNECILAAMKIIPEFKKQYKLQIVNTVFLTDGEGHGSNRVYVKEASIDGNQSFLVARSQPGTMIIRDKKTMHQVVCNHKVHSSSLPFLEMLKQTTGCNVIGFYVTASRNFRQLCYKYASKADDFDLLRSEFRKNNYHVFTSAGYDEYYILRAEGMDTDEEVEFEVKENATTRGLVTAFNKYTKGRLNNRVVLNRFIGLIS